MIDRIGHINIRTPVFEETLRFYERLMGLRRGDARTMTDQVNNAWLYDESGRAIIHVNSTSENETVPDVSVVSRMNHVAFDIQDFAATEQRLKDMGLDYLVHETLVPGLRLLTTQDPNGINLELAHGTQNALDPAPRTRS